VFSGGSVFLRMQYSELIDPTGKRNIPNKPSTVDR